MVRKASADQSHSAKLAEINFRPFLGDRVVGDPVFRAMFQERALKTLVNLKELEKRNINFSPFLELGAGSVQRSAALMNYYSAEGVAVDISQGALQNAPYVLLILGYDNQPLRICCDAHHLPFLPNTFQFLFTYRTLHHFGNPIPAVAECFRVLGKGGHFFFNDEPMISPVIRFLRRGRLLSDPPTWLQRLAYRYRLQKVFWDDGALERSLGIIEARYDIDLWRRALSPFAIVDVEVSRRLKIHSNLESPALNAFLTGLIGGNVKGLCLKTGGQIASENIRERLMCLDCGYSSFSEMEQGWLHCGNCGREYPLRDGLIRMLPKTLEAELYPTNS